MLVGLGAGDQSTADDGSVIQLELTSHGIHLGEAMWLLSLEVQARSGSLHLPNLVTGLTWPLESSALVQGQCNASSTLQTGG